MFVFTDRTGKQITVFRAPKIEVESSVKKTLQRRRNVGSEQERKFIGTVE
ncbi:hypothetical protein YC2023_077936 [Brassica napus]